MNEDHEMSSMHTGNNPFESSNPSNPFLQQSFESADTKGLQQVNKYKKKIKQE